MPASWRFVLNFENKKRSNVLAQVTVITVSHGNITCYRDQNSFCFGPKRIVGKCESNQFDSLYGGPDMQRLGDYNHMQKPDILKQFFNVFQRIGLKTNNRIS